jgi:predicted phage tail protein
MTRAYFLRGLGAGICLSMGCIMLTEALSPGAAPVAVLAVSSFLLVVGVGLMLRGVAQARRLESSQS